MMLELRDVLKVEGDQILPKPNEFYEKVMNQVVWEAYLHYSIATCEKGEMPRTYGEFKKRLQVANILARRK